MSKIALVTDSTSYIPKDLVDKYQINVAPQILIWGEESFEDGVNILPSEFYTRLKKATVMPSTSQVTVTKFQEIFQRLLEQEYQVLAILIADKLSGTINSAVQAKAMLPADAPIEICDSNTTAMAMGFHVLTVARAIEQGASLPECVRLAQEATKLTGVYFAVDTLEFLHRGGRIGTGSRFLGTALNIKPILEVRNGAVEAVERVRTRRKSLSRIIELVEQQIGGRTPVRLATLHANSPEDARIVLEEANQKLGAVESIFSEVSPVIGTHAGPGTVGLAFMAGM
ncbi:MAG: DegV family protein [Anaerolineales bacterium]|nr:DegV family protein [Anaerolineae bacterium]PWB56389.1 MAG: DegV family protein [Anaerolineales bacterium]